MWRGPIMTTGEHTQTSRLTIALVVSRKVKVKSSAVFICPPLAKLQKIVDKLLLRGSLMDSRAQLFSAVALIVLVMAKHHSTMKAKLREGETKNANSRRKLE